MLFLLATGLLAASCHKEDADTVDFQYLTDVKWKTWKAETVFNGQLVTKNEDFDSDGYVIYGYDEKGDGKAWSYKEDGTLASTTSFAILEENKAFTVLAFIIPIIFEVRKLTKNELVADMYVPSLNSAAQELDGGIVSNFKGKDIHKDSDSDTFWYDNNGTQTICSPVDSDNWNSGWSDAVRYYYKRVD
jgi:hypothetical protein